MWQACGSIERSVKNVHFRTEQQIMCSGRCVVQNQQYWVIFSRLTVTWKCFCHFRNKSELINPYSEIKGKVSVGTSWNSSSFVLSQGKIKTNGNEITNCCNCFSSSCSHYLWNQPLSLWTYYSWHFVWHRFILIKLSVWSNFFFFIRSNLFNSQEIPGTVFCTANGSAHAAQFWSTNT